LDLGHGGHLHPGLLELLEGPTGLDGLRLLDVPDEDATAAPAIVNVAGALR